MREAAAKVDPSEVLVAIPTLNEAVHIATTIDALMGGDPAMEKVRIVVADGGSTDGTRDIVAAYAARHPNVRLIDNPDRLQSAAVNRVVETCADARHTILVRVDAHSLYDRDYVLSVANSLVAHDADALATVMDSDGPTCFQRGAAWGTDTKIGSGGSCHRGGTWSGWVDHGHHAGFRLDIWRRVGGYNSTFVANEDAELDYRIGLAGGRIWLDATIRLKYVMRPTLRKLALQYWRYGIGRAQTIREHRMRPRLRQVIPPVFVAANLLGLLLSPLGPVTLLIPAIYILILAATVVQLLLRHRCACALWAGPAIAVMHHAWSLGFMKQYFSGRVHDLD